jgi:hypothetical protein
MMFRLYDQWPMRCVGVPVSLFTLAIYVVDSSHIVPVSPIHSAYHGIGRADPHIPTKFTNSRSVISAYYATFATSNSRVPA